VREAWAKIKRCSSVTKNDFASTLRAHQAAVDAIKSLQRDVKRQLG